MLSWARVRRVNIQKSQGSLTPSTSWMAPGWQMTSTPLNPRARDTSGVAPSWQVMVPSLPISVSITGNRS